ncbi:hypothetical protein CMI41_03095 [Candidatus Pacearchaeota archaeon]|nr:hypothetical protein [Candidatus Pacearchaeota archaeon]|tara:strand:+ start:26592 stop:26918 length:327 start_codon:yes stop_codon:yes gene_type:complete
MNNLTNISDLENYSPGDKVQINGEVGVYVGLTEIGSPRMHPARKCPVVINIIGERTHETTYNATPEGKLGVLQATMGGGDITVSSLTIRGTTDKDRELAERTMPGVAA